MASSTTAMFLLLPRVLFGFALWLLFHCVISFSLARPGMDRPMLEIAASIGPYIVLSGKPQTHFLLWIRCGRPSAVLIAQQNQYARLTNLEMESADPSYVSR